MIARYIAAELDSGQKVFFYTLFSHCLIQPGANCILGHKKLGLPGLTGGFLS